MNLSETDTKQQEHNNHKETVTKLIGNEYQKWNTNKVVFIEAGTGRGKSHFIKNTLYGFAKNSGKKILLLSNRKNLLEQNIGELEKEGKLTEGVIYCYNYQKLDYQESHVKNGDTDKYMNLKDFDYIVCDECHYFFTDATFNKFTDVSLKKILESNAIKIFMSATPRIVKKYIQKEVGKDNILSYSLTTDYSYISQLYFYHSSQVIEDNLLDNLMPDEKVIYFNRSAEDCYRLRKKYKSNSMFVVSESNSLYKFVDEQAKQQILKTKKLQRQILFTTSCMDNGINIEDKSIKHIIIDIRDIDTFIQCLGRKRIEDEEDTITLYIRHVDNRQLGGMVTGGKNKLAIADELDLLGTEKWIKKYPKEKLDTSIIYYGNDKELHVNQVAYMKYQDNVKVAEALLGLSKAGTNKIQREYQYASIVARKLNCQWSVYDTLFKRREFEQYLEENVGKRLSKEKQLRLKEQFELAGLKVKSGNGMGLKTMTGFLADLKLPYKIESRKVKVEGKQHTAWIIMDK